MWVMILLLPVVLAQEAPNAASPVEQYRALLKQLRTQPPAALSDAERKQYAGEVYRRRYRLAHQFVALAEKYPRDPVALDALGQAVWQVNTRPWPVALVGRDDARGRAFELLERDHLRSDKLGPICRRLSRGYCREYETFLRAVLDTNPHRHVRAQACLSLGQFLNHRRQRIDLLSEQPDRAREFTELFGEDYLRELQRQNRTEAIREVEDRFEEAIKAYGDVDLPDVGLVRERAKLMLFEVRNLVVGKTAPDIEGLDQDGQSFKLSDYRGKVVLLDFWSQY